MVSECFVTEPNNLPKVICGLRLQDIYYLFVSALEYNAKEPTEKRRSFQLETDIGYAKIYSDQASLPCQFAVNRQLNCSLVIWRYLSSSKYDIEIHQY